MFPSHDAVVAAVPDYDRYPHLDELETWTDACAAAHPGVEVWQAGASRAGTRLTRLTVSIGVAVFPHRTSSPEDLVGNADAALYKAKRGGKDRVESYG